MPSVKPNGACIYSNAWRPVNEIPSITVKCSPRRKSDLSFSIKDYTKRKLLEDYILEFQDELLKDVYIFDYFHNEKNAEIKIGFRLVFQSSDSTITEFQVNDIISDIISHTQKIKGITLPGLK